MCMRSIEFPLHDYEQISSRHCLQSHQATSMSVVCAQIWSLAQGGREVHCPTGSDYWMIDVAFSESGTTVVSLCDSIEVRAVYIYSHT